MLRILALLVALVAAPLGALLVPHAGPPDAPGGGGAAASWAGAAPGAPLVLDASAMPGRAGWILVPVTASLDTRVRLDVRLKEESTDSGPGGYALVLAFSGQPAMVVGGGRSSSTQDVEANGGSLHVTCCEAGSTLPLNSLLAPAFGASGGAALAGGPLGVVGPQKTLWIGLVAVGWDDGSKMRVTITPNASAALAAGAPHVGTRVAAVDLVEAARRGGTDVLLGGATVAGSPGEADVRYAPEGTGLLVLAASARGDASAALTVGLSNGTPLHDDPVRDGYRMIETLKPGPIELELRDVREPSAVEQATDRRSSGTLGAIGLLADLDVPLQAFLASSGSYETDG